MSASKSTSSRGLRLDAYLSRAGLASRREARILIRKSQVCVDGEVCRGLRVHVVNGCMNDQGIEGMLTAEQYRRQVAAVASATTGDR